MTHKINRETVERVAQAIADTGLHGMPMDDCTVSANAAITALLESGKVVLRSDFNAMKASMQKWIDFHNARADAQQEPARSEDEIIEIMVGAYLNQYDKQTSRAIVIRSCLLAAYRALVAAGVIGGGR